MQRYFEKTTESLIRSAVHADLPGHRRRRHPAAMPLADRTSPYQETMTNSYTKTAKHDFRNLRMAEMQATDNAHAAAIFLGIRGCQ